MAAEQGYAVAQFNLGAMYVNGMGVLQDNRLAHMWFNIAGLMGYKQGFESRDILENEMKPAQISEAQEMARDWMSKHQ